jgi:hypothetical protein
MKVELPVASGERGAVGDTLTEATLAGHIPSREKHPEVS